jgi:hypothetical protein
MELKKLMKEAGIVGAGGAGFPSYGKLFEGAKTLLVNGSECEPLLYTDYYLLKNELSLVLSGIVGVLDAYAIPEAVLAMKEHTAARLSISDGDVLAPRVRVRVLADVYPIGDELGLIYEALGKSVKAGSLPSSVGGIVYNVEIPIPNEEIHAILICGCDGKNGIGLGILYILKEIVTIGNVGEGAVGISILIGKLLVDEHIGIFTHLYVVGYTKGLTVYLNTAHKRGGNVVTKLCTG